MLKICVDTSFLISFSDDSRPNHSTAVDYFRHCVANGYLLCLPTLVVSEFEVGQPASDLPLQHFHVVPFNYRHAVRSADYHKVKSKSQWLHEPNSSPFENSNINRAPGTSRLLGLPSTEEWNPPRHIIPKVSHGFYKDEQCCRLVKHRNQIRKWARDQKI